MEKIEIKGINLKVGKKELNLSVQEAKELKRVLNELFEREVVKEVIHQHCPQWWWNQPSVIYCSSTNLDGNAASPYGFTITGQSASISTTGFLSVNVD